MAVKHIISPGIGFSPGSVEYIVTRGFGASAIVPSTDIDGNFEWEDDRRPFVNDDFTDTARIRLKEAY